MVVSTAETAPGTELTIRYTADPSSNLDLLLAWGFTGRPSPLDCVLPLAVSALPGLDVEDVAEAAANLITGHSRGTPTEQQDLQSQLLAAAASLPLAMLPATGGGVPMLGSTTAALRGKDMLAKQMQQVLHLDPHYHEAAQLISQYGPMLSLSPWLIGLSSRMTGGLDSSTTSKRTAAPAGAVDVYQFYVSSSSSNNGQQPEDAKAAALQVAVAAALQRKEGTSRRARKDRQRGAGLQLVSARACRAAVQLQLLLAASLSAARLVRPQQQPQQQPHQHLQSAAGSQQRQPLQSRCVEPAHCQQRDGPAGESNTSACVSRAAHHWQEAQELQNHITAQLLVLQAQVVLTRQEELPASSAAGAAARQVLVAGKYAQLSGLVELVDLQEQQSGQLQLCAQQLSGNGDPAVVYRAAVPNQSGVERLSCREAAVVDANARQASTLLVCDALLECVLDTLQTQAIVHEQM